MREKEFYIFKVLIKIISVLEVIMNHYFGINNDFTDLRVNKLEMEKLIKDSEKI